MAQTISGKYLASPHGVFEMKYFFTPGYQTATGESMSNTSVKGAIATAIFLFAQDRAQLRGTYTRVLADFQGGLGGPIVNTHRGVFSEINRLFALNNLRP